MNNSEFTRVVKEQLNKCESLLCSKGREYSLEKDRLIAFKRAAQLQNETPQAALCGMLAKHIISVYDMCLSDETFTLDRWDEKITDSINYFLLLSAVVRENERHT